MQTTLGTETMYVHACPLGHCEYWWTEDITEEYASLPCEVCDSSYILVEAFGTVPGEGVAFVDAVPETGEKFQRFAPRFTLKGDT